MAQLNDTMVQGDLRVTGSIFNKLSDFNTGTTGATGRIPLYIDDHNKLVSSMDTNANLRLNYDYISGDTTLVNSGRMIPALATASPSDGDLLVYKSGDSPGYGYMEAKSIVSVGAEPLLTVSRGVVKSTSGGNFPTAAEGMSPTGNILGFNCVDWASLGENQYGIVFKADSTSRCGLTYNNSYILGTNNSFRDVSDIGYDTTSHYFQGMSQSARKAKYAEYALSGGALANTLNDKMNKDASNATTGDGTGAAPTLLEGMEEGTGDITSGDVFIPTTNSGGGTDGKWYKRKISHLWTWIKSQLTGSGVNIGGNSASATRVNGYILNNSSGAEMYRVSLGYAAVDSNAMEANITALVSLEVASGAGGTGSGLAFIVKYNSRGTVRNVSTRLLVDNHYSTNNRPVVLTVTDNTNNRLYFYVANVNSSNALQRFNWSKIRVTPLTDVQNFTWSIAGDTSTSYTTMYKVDEIANAAKTIYDWHSGAYMKLYVGGLGSDPDTIYIQ